MWARDLIARLGSWLAGLDVDAGEAALGRWRRVLRLAVVAIGAAGAWRGRLSMNADGVQYLDLSDALLQGEWSLALNRYWSPLYPAVLALFRGLGRSSPHPSAWELEVVHVANFALFLLCLVAFERLLDALLRPLPSVDAGTEAGAEAEAAPSRALLVLAGYPMFLWATARLIGLHVVTPDLCVAAAVLFACEAIVRLRDRATPRQGLALGLALGLGFLAKAPMLFIGAGLLGVAWLAAGLRRGVRAILVAAAVYAAIGGAYVAALSRDEGRFTTGESGRLNYAWTVNRVTPHAYARPNLGPYGTLTHPPRRIHNRPRVYEFDEPIRTTYAIWYDPPYWYDGLESQFDAERQLRRLRRTYVQYNRIGFESRPVLALFFAALLAAALVGRRPLRRAVLDLGRAWWLLLPALGPLAMYGLVHVVARYVAPFLLLLGLAMLAGLRVARAKQPALCRPTLAVAVVMVVVLAADVLTAEEGAADDTHLRVAVALRERGIEPGDRLGHVGNSFQAFWARLARVRIVTDVPKRDVKAYWAASPTVRQRVLDVMAQTGVRAIVAPHKGRPGGRWQRLGDTDFYVIMLDDPTRGAAGGARSRE
jgi:hypothetical protein